MALSFEDIRARQDYQEAVRVANELDVDSSQYGEHDQSWRELTDRYLDLDSLALVAHERVEGTVPDAGDDPETQQWRDYAVATLISIWVDGFIVASRYAEAEHARG